MFYSLATTFLYAASLAEPNLLPRNILNQENIIAYSLSADNLERPIYLDDSRALSHGECIRYTQPFNLYSSDLTENDEHGRRTLEEWEYQRFPYRCIVRLIAGFDNDGDGIADSEAYGTGCLVGPHTILSCAHLIYSNDSGWCVTLKARIGEHRSSLSDSIVYDQEYTEWTCLTIGNYRNTFNNNDDWSILDLQEDAGAIYGYLGVASNLISTGSSVKLCGYHGDLQGNLGISSGNVTHMYSYSFAYDCYSVGGSSGSPVLVNSSIVVGINASSTPYTSYACTVSSYIVGWIGERL